MSKDEIIWRPEEIVAICKEAGFANGMASIVGLWRLHEFAKLIAAKEREKTLQLWMLLDDVDTADDIAKSDDDVYRSLCRQTHSKRWAVLTGDEVDAAIRARGQA